jgi:hypothetical protein
VVRMPSTQAAEFEISLHKIAPKFIGTRHPFVIPHSSQSRKKLLLDKMPKVRGSAWDSFKTAISGDWKKVGKKLVVVQGAEHSRLYPAKVASKDEKMGFRIDYGSVARDNPDKIKVSLQINSNAKSTALKEVLKSAPRGSHTIFAEAEIDTTETEQDKVEEMLEQLDAGLAAWDEDNCSKDRS